MHARGVEKVEACQELDPEGLGRRGNGMRAAQERTLQEPVDNPRGSSCLGIDARRKRPFIAVIEHDRGPGSYPSQRRQAKLGERRTADEDDVVGSSGEEPSKQGAARARQPEDLGIG